MDRRTQAVGYGLLFALPAGVAATTLVDVLGPVGPAYALLAGAVTALAVFGFVLLVALTGAPDGRESF